MTDHVHYQTDVLLNLSVIGALVLDQLLGWRLADPLVRLRHRRLAALRRLERGKPFG